MTAEELVEHVAKRIRDRIHEDNVFAKDRYNEMAREAVIDTLDWVAKKPLRPMKEES